MNIHSLEREPESAMEAAVTAVRAGECIVLPTDTVYGIGADAFNAAAVAKLLAAKGRGRDMPPPVLVGDPQVMMALGTDISDHAKELAAEHWPGALTIIVTAQQSLQMDLGETRGTIAIRVPDDDATRELLRRTGPLAVSSANRSGHPAAGTVAEAKRQLGGSVAVYLDGGDRSGNAPSTIIDFTRSKYGTVLRHGALGLELLRETVPFLEDGAPTEKPTTGGSNAEVPSADEAGADESGVGEQEQPPSA
ncbi:tRNA threonylcarbamoyl adenosine modification protein (Sua5/YciO/YrdC/YwlC family) [Propioniferax innocua]|uniref:L-threonylcarbamoyladenylate synthase n=1 Tax=Propioniferax innocua TaxID=1753 RepID=A0A542ZB79_9ACTN|nr:tRNA threonylcarbamoyl adenosine modification protein (Sua5/YciO/YrdC/YwlC family) [Propioniferax innocua]